LRPRARKVKPLDDYTLLITFTNNESKVFDVKPYLDQKPFQELKAKGKFETVHIAGLSIEWFNGADICPDELYDDSVPV
jgi:hypothetical protein